MNKLQHRSKQYETVSTRLAHLSNEQLIQTLASAKSIPAGLGGKAALIDVADTMVFVKKVPLTDLEQLPEHFMSTASIYDLPLCFQYGIGAAGFRGWRELAVHTMTTEWVLNGDCAYFPMLYHWRILGRGHNEPNIQFDSDLEKYCQDLHYFGEVSKRVEALHQAEAYIVFFVEYIPQNLYAWLSAEILKGGDAAEAGIAWVDEKLSAMSNEMYMRGLLHFDVHYENVLIEDENLYLTDFGLSLSSKFKLTDAETEFLAQHKSYDQVCAIVNLLQCIVTTHFGKEQWELRLREIIASKVAMLPIGMSAILQRYAPIAMVLDDFFQKLNKEDKYARYPAVELERLLEALS
ncbi:MAG: hypothetical protein K0R48_469 [Gammaproteobacteria bacterium]|nr:hypothetical protein [Gammaproteobacteria bacterium]